jgi:uncharacterized membrane protein YphA (DoxX/SURF4 family)
MPPAPAKEWSEGLMNSAERISWRWPLFFMRVTVGLIFLMAGFWKVFKLTPGEHARRLFLEPYASFWIPTWLLWLAGVAIPFIELITGALLIIGLLRRPCAVILGFLLLTVTYGHLLREPLFDIHTYIFTRLILLLPTMMFSAVDDRFSVDGWLNSRSKQNKTGYAIQ